MGYDQAKLGSYHQVIEFTSFNPCCTLFQDTHPSKKQAYPYLTIKAQCSFSTYILKLSKPIHPTHRIWSLRFSLLLLSVTKSQPNRGLKESSLEYSYQGHTYTILTNVLGRLPLHACEG